MVAVVNPSDPDDVILIRGVVQRPPIWPVVADGGNHQNAVGGDLQDLVGMVGGGGKESVNEPQGIAARVWMFTVRFKLDTVSTTNDMPS